MLACRSLALALLVLLASSAARAQDAEEASPSDAPTARPAPRPARKPPARAGAAPPAVSAWPAGASEVTEVYGDWTVGCRRETGPARCLVTQSQGDPQTRTRRFSLEFSVRDGGGEGLAMMPLPVNAERGMTIKLDDGALPASPFTVCVPEGCLAALALPGRGVETLRSARAFALTAIRPDGAEVTMTVSLKGLAAAQDRAAALQR